MVWKPTCDAVEARGLAGASHDDEVAVLDLAGGSHGDEEGSDSDHPWVKMCRRLTQSWLTN